MEAEGLNTNILFLGFFKRRVMDQFLYISKNHLNEKKTYTYPRDREESTLLASTSI